MLLGKAYEVRRPTHVSFVLGIGVWERDNEVTGIILMAEGTT
jgi:hypothetical protein